MKRIPIALLLITLLLAACQGAAAPAASGEKVGEQVDVRGGSYTDVSVNELQTMLANKDFTFVNVHIPFEGDIPDTEPVHSLQGNRPKCR